MTNGGRGRNQNSLQNSQNERFLTGNMGKLKKNRSFLEVWRQRGGGGLWRLSAEVPVWAFFVAVSIPKLWNQVSDVSAQFVG